MVNLDFGHKFDGILGLKFSCGYFSCVTISLLFVARAHGGTG